MQKGQKRTLSIFRNQGLLFCRLAVNDKRIQKAIFIAYELGDYYFSDSFSTLDKY